MDMPIATGPYRIGRVNFGRDITYQRDPNYWARDLNVRRGMFNFDRITYKIYKDNTAQTEAFKAGEFDYIQVFSARETGRAVYTGKKFAFGRAHQDGARRPRTPATSRASSSTRGASKFKDPRVREALGARLRFRMDEPAADVQFVHARARLLQRERLRGEGAARARTSSRCSSRCARSCRRRVFTEEVPLPPSTDAARQPARQPAQGARAARRSRLDLPRRRAAQRERRAVHARVPRQRRRRAHRDALLPGAREARHRRASTAGPISRSSRSAWTCSTSISSPCASRAANRPGASCSTASARNRPTPKARAI